MQVFFVGSARNVGAPYLQIASQDLVDAAAKALRAQDLPGIGHADPGRPTATSDLERFQKLAEAVRAAHHQVLQSASASRARRTRLVRRTRSSSRRGGASAAMRRVAP